MRAGAAWRIGALGLLLLGPAAGCGGSLPRPTRIVVVTLDTTRADRLGLYGSETAATPNLDRLAGESVVFDQAVSQVPTTLPSPPVRLPPPMTTAAITSNS